MRLALRMRSAITLAVVVLLVAGQPTLAGGGTWTTATSIDDCVDAGVEFFTNDLQRGRSKTYCFEVAPDAEAAHSTQFMSFPNVRPASARVMAANGCHLGVGIPQWEARRQFVVSAPQGKRRVNDYGLPERYDGDFKTARASVSCEREGSPPVAAPERHWQRIAGSPFGAHDPAYAWTGQELVVVDVRSGRTASYDLAADTWVEHERAPDRYDWLVAWTWTGSELLVIPDRLVADPAAFDPATDSWRTLAPMPPEIYFDPEYAIWTGEVAVVAGGSTPQAAAYDPAGDTWNSLPRLPSGYYVIGLTWTGSHVLAETQEFGDQDIDVALLEPGAEAWAPGAPSPVDPGVGPGLWIGDSLVYLNGDEEIAGPESNAAYYPDRDEWRTVERACDVDTIEGLAAGRLIINHSGRRAMDIDTGECHDYPKPPHRLYGGDAQAWTGHEVIYWSGIASLIDPPERKGLVFRPYAEGAAD